MHDRLDSGIQPYDLLIIGGGINGVGIAAEASRRGLRVALCEMNDLGSATSSSSSKLIHGGLRYLEQYQFGLVRKALAERERLMALAPHLIQPLRFCLPYRPGLRPAWLIRLGLWLYDHLGNRGRLPPSRAIRFDANGPLQADYRQGFEYYDALVDDSRLVIATAQAARECGASILPRTRCLSAQASDTGWALTLKDGFTAEEFKMQARVLVNATGPWVNQVYRQVLQRPPPRQIRLVKGSHLLVPRLHEGNEAYILQNDDRRIIFVIPFRERYSLIGTTDVDYQGDPGEAAIDDRERDYLLTSCNRYFRRQLRVDDICWDFSGVRPLIDDRPGSAQAASRDFSLVREAVRPQSHLLSVFGGKITTYRVLADQALDSLAELFPGLPAAPAAAPPLPGGGFDNLDSLHARYRERHPWLEEPLLQRWLSAYGTRTSVLIGDCRRREALGRHFGHGLYQREVDYLCQEEWVRCAEDLLWRRTKLGLALNSDQQGQLEAYLRTKAQRDQA